MNMRDNVIAKFTYHRDEKKKTELFEFAENVAWAVSTESVFFMADRFEYHAQSASEPQGVALGALPKCRE